MGLEVYGFVCVYYDAFNVDNRTGQFQLRPVIHFCAESVLHVLAGIFLIHRELVSSVGLWLLYCGNSACLIICDESVAAGQ